MGWRRCAGIAGLLALLVALRAGAAVWRELRMPAALLGGLVGWGLVSALWAINPARSLEIAMRLAVLFAAALALVAAAGQSAAPRRLLCWLGAGLAVGIVLAGSQFFTGGWLTNPFSKREFVAPALNQFENGLAVLLMPLTALLLVERRRYFLAAAAAVGMAMALFLLVGTTAKAGFAVGAIAAVVLYLARRPVARLAAAISVAIILTAPLTFPALHEIPAVHDWAAGYYKWSARHRLEIWWFTGQRIAEHPLRGWGLDFVARDPRRQRADTGGPALAAAAST